MIYKNTTKDAILAMEEHRMMEYDDGYKKATECDVCQRPHDTIFKIGRKSICPECACEWLREVYAKIEMDMTENGADAQEILKDIIDDFSDSELLCYIESRYEKL